MFLTSTRQWIENLISFCVFIFCFPLPQKNSWSFNFFSFSLLFSLYFCFRAGSSREGHQCGEPRSAQIENFIFVFFSESTTRVLCWDFREAVTISAGNFRSSLVWTAYFLSSGATSLHSTFLFDTRVVLSTGFLINPLSLGLATSVQPLSSSHWIIFKHTSSTKHTSHAVEDGW